MIKFANATGRELYLQINGWGRGQRPVNQHQLGMPQKPIRLGYRSQTIKSYCPPRHRNVNGGVFRQEPRLKHLILVWKQQGKARFLQRLDRLAEVNGTVSSSAPVGSPASKTQRWVCLTCMAM